MSKPEMNNRPIASFSRNEEKFSTRERAGKTRLDKATTCTLSVLHLRPYHSCIQRPRSPGHHWSSASYSAALAGLGPSLRMGILMPCPAKHLLRGVLSMTPGNFFALYTWKASLKHEASTGALPVFKLLPLPMCFPTSTKFIFKLTGKLTLDDHGIFTASLDQLTGKLPQYGQTNLGVQTKSPFCRWCRSSGRHSRLSCR